MKRLLVLVAAALAAAFVVSGCANTRPLAASYNSTDITRDDLNRDLDALLKSKSLAQAASQNQVTLRRSDGSVNNEIAANWLGSLVRQAAIDADFRKRHLKVTASDRSRAEQTVTTQLFGAQAFNEFPKSFRDRLIEREARTEVLGAAIAKEHKVSAADVQRYFDQNKDQICPSGKLVSQILVATQAEAQAVEADLAKGTAFASVAAQRSTDPSKAQGGQVGCLGSAQFLPEFQAAAEKLAPGQVSPPVQSQYGWHVIKVETLTLDVVRTQIEQALQQQSANIREYADALLKKGKVWVDPRYGKVTYGQNGFTIVPPKAPSPRQEPSSSSTTAPTATTAPPAGASTTTTTRR